MPGGYIEGFFKPELDRIMNDLKLVDDQIRAILTGQKIGKAEAPTDGLSAKDILKSARSNFNRREYMMGVADLGRFHKKMWDVRKLLDQFRVDVSKIHHKFLFEGVDDKRIQELQGHMSSLASTQHEYFIKEAGIMDFFYNIGSKRGRALAAWERKYPKEIKELREGGLRLLDESQRLLDNTITYLKEMATARAIRRPDDFLEAGRKIIADFDKFDSGDKGFRAYYAGPIMKWLRVKEDIEAAEKKRLEEEAAKAEKAPKTEVPVARREFGEPPPAPGAAPTVAPTAPPTVPELDLPAPPQPAQLSLPLGGPPGSSPPFAPSPKPEAAPGETTEKTEPPKHAQFYHLLESMGKEDPRILASFIAKYAKSIQGNDPETAIKLFSIVKRLKG